MNWGQYPSPGITRLEGETSQELPLQPSGTEDARVWAVVACGASVEAGGGGRIREVGGGGAAASR